MDAILIDLGFFQIRWYSITMFLGILLGGYLVIREARRFQISDEFMINMFFYLIPLAVIGARLYYVFFNWDYYSNNLIEIVKTWNGGLAIHGAIIVGLIWIYIYTHRYKISTLKMYDMVVPGLILGQVIGRWGNFFNGEAYGPVTSLSFLQQLHLPDFIIQGMYIGGNYHHPTFLYESVWCLIGLIIILIIRRRPYTKIGNIFSIYLIWYGIGRFLIESLRTDSLMLGNLKAAQLVSIAMVIIGIVIIFINMRKSKLENLYNDEVTVDEVKF